MVAVFKAADLNYKTNHKSKDQYAQDIVDTLMGSLDYINNDTLIGVIIGNEEESKWWNGTDNQDTYWFGDQDEGAQFPLYYLAARKKIEEVIPEWNKLDIISGGSIEKHGWMNTPYIEYTDGQGEIHHVGSPREFLKGFLNAVKSEGIGYMPDIIDFHSYSGHNNPEYYNNGIFNTEYSETILFDRLIELESLVNEVFQDFPSYNQEYAITEYGFCPRELYGCIKKAVFLLVFHCGLDEYRL